MLAAMPHNLSSPPTIPDRYHHCPSCGRLSRFRFVGEQHWPAHIAEATGIEPIVRLWTCQSCNSTLSEPDMG